MSPVVLCLVSFLLVLVMGCGTDVEYVDYSCPVEPLNKDTPRTVDESGDTPTFANREVAKDAGFENGPKTVTPKIVCR